jgi:putative transposase
MIDDCRALSFFPSMTLLRHYDHLNTVRFVTFSCYRRLPLLTEETNTIVVFHIDSMRRRTGAHLLGWVIMPEHVHLVLYPPDAVKLGFVIGRLKAFSSRDIFARWSAQGKSRLDLRVERNGHVKNVFWQRRCYDHNCRNWNTVLEKIRYCHNNPVRRGLVAEPRDRIWSSCRWYLGERDVPLLIDALD